MAKKKFGLDSIRGASAAVNGTVTVDTQVNTKENTELITNREIEDKMQVGAGLINQDSIMMHPSPFPPVQSREKPDDEASRHISRLWWCAPPSQSRCARMPC